MTALELLAPARNAEIGIAAIDCGADAVYIAGPSFGARQAAGNSLEDIAGLCTYAHRFGARIFLTVNTIIYDNELEDVRALLVGAARAGVDAFIVQDLAVARLAAEEGLNIPLHASTQCSVRTPAEARLYEDLGFSRLVLERQLSLGQVRAIREATGAELEFFVFGALCVCYSGQCYLSEELAGRSANRGACAQACRSRYDLLDGQGKTLLKDKAVLSLKDYNLLGRIGDLAEAGICSFKIEGRLKNISYVRNIVREASMALDNLVAGQPGLYCRSSYGRVVKGFAPDPRKTFNRGYTELFIDGKRGRWASMDMPKSMGEPVGTVASLKPIGRDSMDIILDLLPSVRLSNGDGFTFSTGSSVEGFRGDVCTGNVIRTKKVDGLHPGTEVYRNLSTDFEKILEANPCRRFASVGVKARFARGGDPDNFTGRSAYTIDLEAVREDGARVFLTKSVSCETAKDTERAEALFRNQIEKTAGDYTFSLTGLDPEGGFPFLPAAFVNGLRRELSEELGRHPVKMKPMSAGKTGKPSATGAVSYKANVANRLARESWLSAGATSVEDAFELSHRPGAELMRSRYCVRHELGLCTKGRDGSAPRGHERNTDLFLLNNGRRLRLSFDCARCEMVVSD